MSEVKLCKDCKHFSEFKTIYDTTTSFSMTCHRRSVFQDLVTGNTYQKILSCNEERYPTDSNDDYCDIEGKFWEAK